MITAGILYILYSVAWGVTYPLRLFADASLPSFLTNAITNVQPYVSALDNIVPVGTIISVIGFVVTVELAVFSYKGVIWILKTLHVR